MELKSWFLFLLPVLLAETRILTREKRFLVYTPRTSIVQLILGLGIPVPLEDNQALTVGYVLKAAYQLPNNATYFTNPYVNFQKRSNDGRRASRFELYHAMGSILNKIGGKSCVLQAICEAAQIPLKRIGIVGHILHIILTPSTTDEIPTSKEDEDYLNAEKLGTDKGASCQIVYPQCATSLLDLLTISS